MTDVIQHPYVQALAWALVNFLWQGAAIGLASFIAFRLIRQSPRLRYGIGVAALVAMVLAPVVTFLTVVDRPVSIAGAPAEQSVTPAAEATANLVTSLGTAVPAGPEGFRISPDTLALAVGAWLLGVMFFSIRLFGGWMVARTLARRAVQPVSTQIDALARNLADRLAVSRIVTVLQSSSVAVPVMVGWIKPTIVLPMAALAGLTPTQVEALLAHELAHIRRHDYLVNVLQSVVEAVLFYHPVTWWLSRRVRAERELCCDDVAVSVCDRLVYATALTDLAAMTSPRLALAATDGDLLSRVRRILSQADATSPARAGSVAILTIALVAGIGLPAALVSATQAPARPQSTTHHEAHEAIVTTHKTHGPATMHATNQDEAAMHLAQTLEQETAAQQAERQKVIEELRRKIQELSKALNELMSGRGDEAKPKAEAEKQMQKQMLDQIKMAEAARAHATKVEIDRARMLAERGLVTENHVKEMVAAAERLHRESGNAAEAAKAAQSHELQSRYERLRALFEKGLVGRDELAKAEAKIKETQLRMHSDEAMLAQHARAAAEKSTEDARRMRELLADQSRATIERNATAAAEIQRAARTVERLRETRERLQEVRPEELARGSNEPVRAGDVLRVVINGEPDLPTSYQVRENGTIRVPFVGSLKVTGLTAAQVREAIGKQLSDKKLGSASQVTVTLLRNRRE